MDTSTKLTAALCGLVLSLAATACGDDSGTQATGNESDQSSKARSWTPGPDLDSGAAGAVVDGPTYDNVASLVGYGKTAITATFEPETAETSSKNLMKWDEPVSGMDLTVWTVHVDETLTGEVPDESIDVILAGGPNDIGAEPGDRAVLFLDTIRTPSGQMWNVAGVNQGIVALDADDRLTPSVDATPQLKQQIGTLEDLDGLRREIQQGA